MSQMKKSQINELHLMIDRKQQRIVQLQSQIKSIKRKYDQRITEMQQTNQKLEKQYRDFQRDFLKSRKKLQEQMTEGIMSIKEQYKKKSAEKDLYYEQLIKQKQSKFQQALNNTQSRYESLMNQLKQENSLLLNHLNKGDKSLISGNYTFGHQDFNINDQQTLKKSSWESLNQAKKLNSIEERQEAITWKLKYEKLEKQIQVQRSVFKELQEEKNIQKQQHQRQKNNLQKQFIKLSDQITQLELSLSTQTQNNMKEKNLMQQTIKDLKNHITQLNHSYHMLLSTKLNSNSLSQVPITTIKSCNHHGLIQQLQHQLQIKNSKIRDLQTKFQNWQEQIGLDKDIQIRLHQIGNISDRTNQTYRKQRQRIQSGAKRINPK